MQPTEDLGGNRPPFGAGTTYNDATDGINYETQSIQSGKHYNQSAIGEMNIDELH
jgi:hypothetical protein